MGARSPAFGAYPEPEGRGGELEHIGVIVQRVVLRTCAGCGSKVRGRDLIEVTDWHESLTFFEGDELCQECAAGHGAL